jgi:hypothetical protein
LARCAAGIVWRRRRLSQAQFGYGFHQADAMAQRKAKLLQMCFLQVEQSQTINIVICERIDVLRQT